YPPVAPSRAARWHRKARRSADAGARRVRAPGAPPPTSRPMVSLVTCPKPSRLRPLMWASRSRQYKITALAASHRSGTWLDAARISAGAAGRQILECPARADAGNTLGPFGCKGTVEGAGAGIVGVNQPGQEAAALGRGPGGKLGHQPAGDALAAGLG